MCKHSYPKRRRSGFTLIELLVVVSIIALLIAILLPSLTKAREQARSAKCLGNMHAVSLAVATYVADRGGVLPGPLHPAVVRNLHTVGDLSTDHSGLTDADKQKSLIWLLRPYFQSGGTYNQESKVADEVSKCPTATIISPDPEWPTGNCLPRPYSYGVNSFGAYAASNGAYPDTGTVAWFHTAPGFYFGVQYYCDSPSSTQARFGGGIWSPKPIERVKFASAEWAVGDAWYRGIPATSSRPGSKPRRTPIGTFPSGGSGQPLPSVPYHGVPTHDARATRNQASASGVLPVVSFKGWTNLAFFDGHAASSRGQWLYEGQGGTVNPFWKAWGGIYPP